MTSATYGCRRGSVARLLRRVALINNVRKSANRQFIMPLSSLLQDYLFLLLSFKYSVVFTRFCVRVQYRFVLYLCWKRKKVRGSQTVIITGCTGLLGPIKDSHSNITYTVLAVDTRSTCMLNRLHLTWCNSLSAQCSAEIPHRSDEVKDWSVPATHLPSLISHLRSSAFFVWLRSFFSSKYVKRLYFAFLSWTLKVKGRIIS